MGVPNHVSFVVRVILDKKASWYRVLSETVFLFRQHFGWSCLFLAPGPPMPTHTPMGNAVTPANNMITPFAQLSRLRAERAERRRQPFFWDPHACSCGKTNGSWSSPHAWRGAARADVVVAQEGAGAGGGRRK